MFGRCACPHVRKLGAVGDLKIGGQIARILLVFWEGDVAKFGQYPRHKENGGSGQSLERTARNGSFDDLLHDPTINPYGRHGIGFFGPISGRGFLYWVDSNIGFNKVDAVLWVN